MKIGRFFLKTVLSISLVSFALIASAEPLELHSSLIERNAGKPGKFDKKNNTFKISIPRNDLAVNANGQALAPAMGLTSWISFKSLKDKTMNE